MRSEKSLERFKARLDLYIVFSKHLPCTSFKLVLTEFRLCAKNPFLVYPSRRLLSVEVDVVLDDPTLRVTLKPVVPATDIDPMMIVTSCNVKDLANQWLLLLSVSNFHHLMAAVLDPLLSWHGRLRTPVSLWFQARLRTWMARSCRRSHGIPSGQGCISPPR